MDLPATQAMDEEDFVPTQKFVTDDKERERILIGTLVTTDSQHPIHSGITIIGRLASDCTIVFNDETVSKKHAEIEAESTDKAIFIKDLESSNKTKINNTKLRPRSSYQVKDNDQLTFGKITATFKLHRPVDDSLISGTPQVTKKANSTVIPDTPDSSMNNSSVMEGDVSSIPGTQANEDDSCFRRPQIPVRTSISNEHESPKHVPFMLDDVPSPLSKDDNGISDVETQRFTVDNTKQMTDRSIYNVETQKFINSEISDELSYNNESHRRTLNNSSVRKVLTAEFGNQSLEDAETQRFEKQLLEDLETQEFVFDKPGTSSGKPGNVSIYSAETQQVLAQENQSIENAETQVFIPVTSAVDKNHLLDVSIHSAATQKVEAIVSENDIENLETQPFIHNNLDLNSRKSTNISIHSAETQKVIADVSNQSFDEIQTQKLDNDSESSKLKADVSIYSAATQSIDNLETQKFENTRNSLHQGSHQTINQEKIASSMSFSIQDIDTMPFITHELPLDEKLDGTEPQNDDILLDPTANTATSSNEKDVQDSGNSEAKVQNLLQTSSKATDETRDVNETNEGTVSNEKVGNETLSKSFSKDVLQSSCKLDRSKSLVESEDEEEIFSQNLVEECPFRLLLDDSKNDSNRQSVDNLQNDKEVEVGKIEDIPSNKDTSMIDENAIENKSTTADNDDSETDEEGVFSNNLSKENENKAPKETGSDSETDEEGVFSNHLTEEDGGIPNSKPEADSETDEEGIFSGRPSADSKKMKSDNKSRIIAESDSEDDGIFSDGLSSNKAGKDSVNPEESITKSTEDSSALNKSTEIDIPVSTNIERPINKLEEIVKPDSPIPESDDDIFNENDDEKRTSTSDSNKVNCPATDNTNLDSTHNSLVKDAASPGPKNPVNDISDVDDLAPTQMVETEDLSLAPTQIVNTCQATNVEKVDDMAPTQLMETESLQVEDKFATVVESNKEVAKTYDDIDLAPTQIVDTCQATNIEEVDDLAPTQLMETQSLQVGAEDNFAIPAPKVTAFANSDKNAARAHNDLDCAPTQKMIETQECTESLAPTQKVVDTQVYSEEMGALQFSESLGAIENVEPEPSEIAASPQKTPNTSKRQLEEIEITSNKKLRTAEPQKVDVDLNSTVEMNLNEMFEGPEEKVVNSEPPIQTQQLENILESSQIEDVSTSQPSPTLSSKRSSIRGKNRRRMLSLNKSRAASNDTNKSVVNLNDTIEKNLNELFDSNVDNVEAPQPEPMLTQQLENVLNSSQDSSPVENKEEEGRNLNVSRKRSRLSLSMIRDNSMKKTQEEKETNSPSVQSTSPKAETIPRDSLDKKLPQKVTNEDYSANLEINNATDEQIPSKNDKDIVYRRGTKGFADDLTPVSTFDRVAFLDKYSASDSQSDGDDTLKLPYSPSYPHTKKRASLRLKSVELKSSSSSSTSKRGVKNKEVLSPVLSSKRGTPAKRRPPRKQNPVVRLKKLSSPLYRKHAKPDKRVMACGTIGFTENLDPVETDELVSAASTESENELRVNVSKPSPKDDINNEPKPAKRVMACGTIGFTDSLHPVETDELVSAASTESEDELRVKVCKHSPKISIKVDVNNEPTEKQSTEPSVDEDENESEKNLNSNANESSPKIDSDIDFENEQLPSDSPMDDDKSESDDEFGDLPQIKIAGTTECPATCSQLAVASDSESVKSIKIEIKNEWKCYAEKRFDSIYGKYVSKTKGDDSESENDEDEGIHTNDEMTVDDQEARRAAAIDELLAKIDSGKDVKKRESNGVLENDENFVTTRSRKLRKTKTPSPPPAEDSDSSDDNINPVKSGSSDSESSEELSILPKYRPVSPFKLNTSMLNKVLDDDDDSELEFEALCGDRKSSMNNTKAKTSPPKTRRRRKSACNNEIKDVTQYKNNDGNVKLGNPIIGTVDKDSLVFQVSHKSKTTAPATTTSRTSGPTSSRTKRIIDEDDDESTHQPSPKRTKTIANREKLLQATVVISPLRDKLIKLRQINNLNLNNVPTYLVQSESIVEKKRATRAPKTLDDYVIQSKTVRTGSSDMSAVENSIVEDKNKSKTKTSSRGGRLVARNKKTKVDTTPERSANSSKENLEEAEIEKPKTRGRGRRNQTTDSSSVSGRDSSQDEISASSVENKSTRSTRGRLVRQNQTTKVEAKSIKKDSEVISDSDSEVSKEPKNTKRKNTRDRSSKNSSLSKVNAIADSKNDNIQDKKNTESQSSSQSQSVSARTTRTRKNKVIQESDSGCTETPEVTSTRSSRRKPTNNKSDLVVNLEVDSSKEDTMKSEDTEDEVNVFKQMKKKMIPKPEEPTTVPARKTRARATKNTKIEESSSEESQEVAKIMENSISEESKPATRRRGRQVTNSSIKAESTESSDDIFEKPTSRPKRARVTKADKSKLSQVSDSEEDSTLTSQRSTRRKHSPSPSPTPLSPAALTPSRKSRLSLSPSKRPKVLFTGEKSEAHRQILTKLGGVETEDINNCTVLITDKVRRTFKFLCSLARGIPIASVKWLNESNKANHFLDLEEYILNDPEAEAKYKFNLKKSLDKARKHKLLEGYTILLAPKIKQPPVAELKEMVISSGGKLLARAPAKWSDKSIVITTEQELDSAKKFIAKAPKSVTIQSVEFILTGILRQDTNFNEFKLLA